MPLSKLERIKLALPAFRLAWPYVQDGDAWHSLPHDVPLALYGPGNLADDFSFYLQGPSSVSIRSIRELCYWLRKCEYHCDSVLFGRSDYWQHPRGFETLRRGDCEDHALWAWRKLIELGHKAELVVGEFRQGEPTDNDMHVWVVYQENGGRFLFETAEKSRKKMIRPLADASHQYRPHASIDQNLQRHLYAGFIDWLVRERERRKSRRNGTKDKASGDAERSECRASSMLS
jgi:Bacterial transglutaminase-like cysteine proteinase BTLCP